MGESPVKQRQFDFSLSLIPKPGYGNPFTVKKEFPLCSQPDDVILFQFLQFEKDGIGVIAPIHDKGCMLKESGGTLQGRKCDGVHGGVKGFLCGMDP